jgi:osmotically-inducible protein OsmY
MSRALLLIPAVAVALGACASSRTLSGTVADIGSDAELKGILVADRQHDYSDVDLTVYEGRLMLTGTMASEEGRRKLVENAWKADGITQVIDEIRIGDDTKFGAGLDDARIDQAIRAKYIASGGIRSGNYKIAVSQGVAYLLGVARDQTELDLALKKASETSGVKSVVSHVILRVFPDAAR